MNLRATTKRRACGQPCGRCSNSAISHLRLTGSYETPGSSRLNAGVKRATTAYCAGRASRAANRIEAEAGVGADSQLTNLGWKIGEAGVQHFNAAIPGASIAGTEFGIPEVG